MQAQQLVETEWRQVGPDMLLTGYLPAAGGLWGLHQRVCAGDQEPQVVLPPPGARAQHQDAQRGHDPSGGARQHAEQQALRHQQMLDQVPAAEPFAPDFQCTCVK